MVLSVFRVVNYPALIFPLLKNFFSTEFLFYIKNKITCIRLLKLKDEGLYQLFESELKVYNIFISHTDKEEEEYSIFIQKLSSAYDFEYKDHGILEKISEDELQEQIEPAGVVIILSGLYNKYKSLIKTQLNITRKLNKPIIVIRPYGVENVLPELEEIAADVVGWNAPCIRDSIEENYLE